MFRSLVGDEGPTGGWSPTLGSEHIRVDELLPGPRGAIRKEMSSPPQVDPKTLRIGASAFLRPRPTAVVTTS